MPPEIDYWEATPHCPFCGSTTGRHFKGCDRDEPPAAVREPRRPKPSPRNAGNSVDPKTESVVSSVP